jgi:hypothetical protein
MKRIIMMLTVALVMAATMAASVMPAFAQGRGEGPQGVAPGPEGGNPGNLNCFQGRTVGENDLQPLPFAGQEPAAGFDNAPGGVVFTSPASPFSLSNPSGVPDTCPETG